MQTKNHIKRAFYAFSSSAIFFASCQKSNSDATANNASASSTIAVAATANASASTSGSDSIYLVQPCSNGSKEIP
jgi:hypothetical protein